MAEDEDGVSEKKSPQQSDNESSPGASAAAMPSSSSTGATKKEDNPFSFRHFLKRDLSLSGQTSTYEKTGARPKVYASTSQHSPGRAEIVETRRDRIRPEQSIDSAPRDSASNSIGAVPDIESKNNLYGECSDTSYYHRPNLASEPLGMPSLPDFVQDHILVEQAYLNSNGPISVDLDNLPDFTFNTSYNQSQSNPGRRYNDDFGGSRNLDYDLRRTASQESGAAWCLPLDLPAGHEAPHLNLDLTESVNPADRRNNSPQNTFPLDLPPSSESMRLPDFLPVHPGRTSPEPAHIDHQLRDIIDELERTRSDLLTERSRRSRLESELSAVRSELATARAVENSLRARLHAHSDGELDVAGKPTDAETNVANLKSQIKRLKEDLSASQAEARSLRGAQRTASRDLRQASLIAESSLRDLLAGVEQIKSLSTSLDPT